MSHQIALQTIREIDILEAQLSGRSPELPTDVQKLIAISDQLRADCPTNEVEWQALAETKRKALLDHLRKVETALRHRNEQDGPTDDDHWMSPDYASNYAIGCLIGFTLVLLTVVLSTVYGFWNDATKADGWSENQDLISASGALADTGVAVEQATARFEDASARLQAAGPAIEGDDAQDARLDQLKAERNAAQAVLQAARDAEATAIERVKSTTDSLNDAIKAGTPEEATVLGLVILLGIAGGCLRILASLVKYVGNRQLARSWLLYYYAMPFQGAVLAPLIYMLLRVGVLSPSVGSQGGTAQVNLLSMYVFAGLTGLFAKNATDKLAEVFETIFRTNKKTEGALKQSEGAAKETDDRLKKMEDKLKSAGIT